VKLRIHQGQYCVKALKIEKVSSQQLPQMKGAIIMFFDGFPFIIGWELTLGCNLQCNHCGSSAGQPRPNELSLKESLALCDQFPELMVQEVNFTGGEPLLQPNWLEIAAHLRDLGISTKILTNGLTLNPKRIDEMRQVGIAGIGISLDGLETTHDYIRGYTGLFNRVLESISLVQDAGMPITIITTVNALNLGELRDMFELLQSRSVKRWQVQPVFPLGRSQESSDFHLTENAYLELGNLIKQLSNLDEGIGPIICPGDSLGYFTDFYQRKPPWQGCPAGLISCGITSDGKIKGCLSLPDEVIEGDVRQNDLWDIWFNQNSFSYTRQFSIEKIGASCQSCDKAEQCKGGCSCMSYASTGSFHNDPLCFKGIEMNHQRKNRFALLE